MIKLISISNPRMAQAFIDYMASRRIDVKMMPEGSGQFALWLTDTQYQVEVEAELQHFLANPSDAKYQAASWDMAESRTGRFSYQSPSMLAMVKAKAGPVTLAVILVCIVIFALQQFGAGQAVFSVLHFPAFAGQEWQLWRWVSHAVLHFSVMHIAFNLLWWWQLGGDIEQRLGAKKLLQLFVVSAAMSGAGQYWVEGANFGGLSGVVYALVGYLWVLGYKAPQLGLSIPKPIIGFMLVWLVLGFIQPFMAIANTAHLVGLISGVVVGLIDASRIRK
ncbi:rhomboid family intramembrane serine protease GlpG [Vibrio neptunius]|uniref:Rhomboid family intramembrane serine protease GlpG n=1 Tax=Vibrio neptunius TaxID=170651 RepID=A0ABS3A7T0_9VIBR|nr:rhomboid family intramembrane serine protease GlpG [Vibrio neptunius]KJY90102.1 intramembrane serine protease GlpG [Vibrio neptunius]MBN3495074.1 rhomboid family intramembrane serine protease GlpG [Vibrio neptunius]MBN3517564.1 rhomboid family intramembrane serine protease GlpG [Vibrio neptunius]MBN3551901.1 rhomboid family intramembrane serine protease GlpG [Vibrio neptunius]MBN3579909.1 rhomboid family intramembrane serine protease GlpG [Vibrio neptunius]